MIKPGEQAAFEAAYQQAQMHLMTAKGYRAHVLRRCLETTNRYQLQVEWGALSDHIEGFRNSQAFIGWRSLIGGFFESPPQMEHYQAIDAQLNGAP